jgi:hypothetical protein
MRKTLQTSLTLSTSVLLLLLLLLPCTQEINIDAIAELDFFPIFILSLITFCSLSLSLSCFSPSSRPLLFGSCVLFCVIGHGSGSHAHSLLSALFRPICSLPAHTHSCCCWVFHHVCYSCTMQDVVEGVPPPLLDTTPLHPLIRRELYRKWEFVFVRTYVHTYMCVKVNFLSMG